MVYAAKKGWYREEANMNVLLPHDILRISTILESCGDLDTAKTWITKEKARLKDKIQEDLDFKLLEIDEYYAEDIEFNLNIPRYVDTFEPEEEIDLKEAIAEFKTVINKESNLDKSIDELLKELV